MRVFVRFEDIHRDAIGETLGPFEWVQLSCELLRVCRVEEDNGDIQLAWYDHERDCWIYDNQEWSEVVIGPWTRT